MVSGGKRLIALFGLPGLPGLALFVPSALLSIGPLGGPFPRLSTLARLIFAVNVVLANDVVLLRSPAILVF